jgi:hypothetical protein
MNTINRQLSFAFCHGNPWASEVGGLKGRLSSGSLIASLGCLAAAHRSLAATSPDDKAHRYHTNVADWLEGFAEKRQDRNQSKLVQSDGLPPKSAE